jgi:hypothetical protein
MHIDGRDGHDPHGCPTFSAISYDGETIDGDDSLDALLARLVDAVDLRSGKEELCVWADGESVAAIVRADGSVIRLDGAEPVVVSHQTTPGPRSTNGKAKRPR